MATRFSVVANSRITGYSARSVESNAAAGSHQRCRPQRTQCALGKVASCRRHDDGRGRSTGRQPKQSRSLIGATNIYKQSARSVDHRSTGADGVVLLCRQRCAAVGFKPLQSRAFYIAALPRRWLARDSFPAFGEAKGVSDFRTRSQKEKLPCPLRRRRGCGSPVATSAQSAEATTEPAGENGSAQSALTGEV